MVVKGGSAAARVIEEEEDLGDEMAMDREESVVELCDCMLDLAAIFFGVSGRELRQRGRSRLEVARVRQIAMYVAHTVLDMSMAEVGRGFGRDRTTVLHAVHLVEDMRDHAEFDAIIARTEHLAKTALRGRKVASLRRG